MTLDGKHVVVGMGGGIAAFKAVELVRELGRRGAEVRVVMTQSAARFVGPVTLTGLTGHPAVVDLWDPAYAGEVHVELGDWADAMVVAPATMNLMARAVAGMADDAVLATLACAGGPVVYAPAMHTRMWASAANQRVVRQLEADGAHRVGPVEGALASGEMGMGRMAEPGAIADAVADALEPTRDLNGYRMLMTAGPTHEDLDPVRFLGNRSSGRMGFALARRAAARGARVVLVSGPSQLPDPPGVETVRVRSARDMHEAVVARRAGMDCAIMAAAVADYRPATRSESKIKKTNAPMTVELVRNPDILAELGASRDRGPRVLVGFAVESGDLRAHAREKRRKKACDLMVANDASVGFAGEENQAVLADEHGEQDLPPMSKLALADRILDRVRMLLDSAP
ncbi:MAG: bifunctional phosphopantothenoylcysteine decarboxylase/phosphopantothenate--cysteine ligase CoaBC [Myxococcota bacterium]